MGNFFRALRLPFVTASALPFLFGSLAAPGSFSYEYFALGLAAVIAAHLGANLTNDYADSLSGADWEDTHSYGFFGGSKLIQEGIYTEGFYRAWAYAFFGFAAAAVFALAYLMASPLVLYATAFILFLSWSYSAKPLALSYRGLGEIAIFVLFGPAVVMGGYYLMSGVFPDARSFLLSLPFGFLTTAILYANEIPDLPNDLSAGKRTWASLLPLRHAWVLYGALVLLAFLSIVFLVAERYLSGAALLALAGIVPAMRALRVLREHPDSKARLLESSKLTIAAQTLVSIILIGALFV